LVNTQSKLAGDDGKNIQAILQKSAKLTGIAIDLAVVYDCPELDKLFPCKSIPQEVWIENSGKVLGITDQTELHEKNLSTILTGGKINLKLKNDLLIDWEKTSLMAVSPDTAMSKMIFSSSLFKGYVDGLNGTGWFTPKPSQEGLSSGWHTANRPMLDIYQDVFREQLSSYPSNRIIFDCVDTINFVKKAIASYFDSDRKDVFTYEFRCTPMKQEQIHKLVQRDFEKMFNTRIKRERREIECYIVRSGPQPLKAITKGGTPKFFEYDTDGKKHIRNARLSDLFREFSYKYFTLPLIDDTGISQNVDLELPHGKLDKDSVIKMFEKAGLTVSVEKRMMDVAIITDKEDEK